jgi:hypothetical protein
MKSCSVTDKKLYECKKILKTLYEDLKTNKHTKFKLTYLDVFDAQASLRNLFQANTNWVDLKQHENDATTTYNTLIRNCLKQFGRTYTIIIFTILFEKARLLYLESSERAYRRFNDNYTDIELQNKEPVIVFDEIYEDVTNNYNIPNLANHVLIYHVLKSLDSIINVNSCRRDILYLLDLTYTPQKQAFKKYDYYLRHIKTHEDFIAFLSNNDRNIFFRHLEAISHHNVPYDMVMKLHQDYKKFIKYFRGKGYLDKCDVSGKWYSATITSCINICYKMRAKYM